MSSTTTPDLAAMPTEDQFERVLNIVERNSASSERPRLACRSSRSSRASASSPRASRFAARSRTSSAVRFGLTRGLTQRLRR
jgi:hypothetical protein